MKTVKVKGKIKTIFEQKQYPFNFRDILNVTKLYTVLLTKFVKTTPFKSSLSVNGNCVLALAGAKTFRVICDWSFWGPLRLLFPLPVTSTFTFFLKYSLISEGFPKQPV